MTGKSQFEFATTPNLNPLVRQHAEEAAGNILQEGVAARWIDCPVGSSSTADCSSTGSPLGLVVNLLPYAMSQRLHQGGGVLGFALEASGKDFGFIASVFYDVAKDRAAEHQQDLGQLLADAIAHELGHLLLGPSSHSGWGLMSAFCSAISFVVPHRAAWRFGPRSGANSSCTERPCSSRDRERGGRRIVPRGADPRNFRGGCREGFGRHPVTITLRVGSRLPSHLCIYVCL